MTDPTASIKQTHSKITGINHIALSVTNLDKVLAFYQSATDFELIKTEKISQNPSADALYGEKNISLRTAVLKAPNMLFELTEFSHNKNAVTTVMPVQGPGMTHTCFQSPDTDSGYDKFKNTGASILSRGDKPVDIGGYGVTYAYGYDPEGNMFEMEQLAENALQSAGYYDSPALNGRNMWLTQVALVSHDIERLMAFYEKLLGIAPFRRTELINNSKIDDIGNQTNSHLVGGWFRLSEKTKVMEMWQFKSPATTKRSEQLSPVSLGYSFSFEVSDIFAEYLRLTDLGIRFVGEPVKLGDFYQVYGSDCDGNIFALRQILDSQSPYSVAAMDN